MPSQIARDNLKLIGAKIRISKTLGKINAHKFQPKK